MKWVSVQSGVLFVGEMDEVKGEKSTGRHVGLPTAVVLLLVAFFIP